MEVLSSEQNGVYLFSLVQRATAEFMVGAEMVEPEDYPTEGPEFVELAKQALEDLKERKPTAKIPKSMLSRTEVWAGTSIGGAKPVTHKAGATGGGGVEGLVSALEPLQIGSGESTLMDDVVCSELDRAKLRSDVMAQGISGTRILSLSLSMELGTVQPLTEVSEGEYGYRMNALTVEKVRHAKKAGVLTLSKIVEKQDMTQLISHLTGLARDYAQRRMIEESTLVSRFAADTTGQVNQAQVWAYLSEFLKEYAGRGLPTTFDMTLAWRVSNGADGSSEAMAKQGREVKDALSQLGEARRETRELKETVKALKAAFGEIKTKIGKPAGDPDGKGRKCFICGKLGHLAKDCPEKPKEEEKDA